MQLWALEREPVGVRRLRATSISDGTRARSREWERWEGEGAHLGTPYAPDADPTSSGSAGVGSARLCLEMSYTPRATKPNVTATCVRMIAMGNSPDSVAVMAVFSPGIVSMTPVAVRARRTRCARSGARSPTVAITVHHGGPRKGKNFQSRVTFGRLIGYCLTGGTGTGTGMAGFDREI